MSSTSLNSLRYFDKIFVINLPSRADRMRELASQFDAIGFRMDDPLVEVFPAIRPFDKGDFDSVGARGCFMSHLSVLKIAARAGYSRVLILEDDINFVPDFSRRMQETVAFLARERWDIFYGGYTYSEARNLADGIPIIGPDQHILCSHFIALQSSAIKLGGEFFEALLSRPTGHLDGGPMHVDGAYCWLRNKNPHLVTKLAVPELGYQRVSRTDIHTLRWFDRLPVLRLAAAAARKLRNRTRPRWP